MALMVAKPLRLYPVCKSLLQTQARYETTDLKTVLANKIPEQRNRIMAFRKKYGVKKMSDIAMNMVYGGGAVAEESRLMHETSKLHPEHGILFRGYTINECREKLPKAVGGTEPLPEALFWLLITGDIPTNEQVKSLSESWAERAELPFFIENMIRKFQPSIHPITQLCSAINALESKFVKSYSQGVFKEKCWDYVFEDTMDLIAKISTIAALIHNTTNRVPLPARPINPKLDWAANFVNMMKLDDPKVADLMRLYLTVHSDYEGDKVSARAFYYIEGSALSDPYKTFAAGLSNLIQPLNTLISPEVLIFMEKLKENVGVHPNLTIIKDYVQNYLKDHPTLPGFGHKILLKTDTRYLALADFAQKHMPDNDVINLYLKVHKILENILSSEKNIHTSHPTIDALNGILLQQIGLKKVDFFPVILSMSQSLGTLSSLFWDRALGIPVDRTKVTPSEIIIRNVPSPKSSRIHII